MLHCFLIGIIAGQAIAGLFLFFFEFRKEGFLFLFVGCTGENAHDAFDHQCDADQTHQYHGGLEGVEQDDGTQR